MAQDKAKKELKLICYFCNRYVIPNEEGHAFFAEDNKLHHCHQECYEMYRWIQTV